MSLSLSFGQSKAHRACLSRWGRGRKFIAFDNFGTKQRAFVDKAFTYPPGDLVILLSIGGGDDAHIALPAGKEGLLFNAESFYPIAIQCLLDAFLKRAQIVDHLARNRRSLG